MRSLAIACLAFCLAAPLRAELIVFGAASLADVLEELTTTWTTAGGDLVRLSLAASSTLARQIEQGAQADLYLSANLAWMDRLEAARLVVPASRCLLAHNRLVLIAPGAEGGVESGVREALLALPKGARIAVADPAHVPAGIYAQAAMETLGLGALVSERAAYTADVRAALTLVARGEAPLGIVYATDVRLVRNVHAVGVFPADTHPPIVYTAARVRASASPKAADALLTFLASPRARAIWRQHGFAAPPEH